MYGENLEKNILLTAHTHLVINRAAGVSKLVFIKGILLKKLYLNIIIQNVVQSAQKLGIGNSFTFIHDTDLKYFAKIVKEYIDYKSWNLLNHPP